jgi:hypothetical protein
LERKKKKLYKLFNSEKLDIFDNNISSYRNNNNNMVSKFIEIILPEIEKIKSYMNLEENDYVRISNVWMQKYKKGMDHSVHNHGNCAMSAVLYIDLPKETQPTRFISPFDDFTTRKSIEFTPNVKEGDIIFFPGFLHHYSPTNKSKKEKFILSFNLVIERNGSLIITD